MKTYPSFESLSTFWEARTAFKDFLTTYPTDVLFSLLLGLFLLAMLTLPPRHRWGPRLRAIVPVGPIVLVYLVYLVTGGAGIRGLPAQFSSVALGIAIAVEPSPPATREPVRIRRTARPAVDQVVVIVDESIRGDFIDFEDPVGTTPFLSRIKDKIIDFGAASAGNNCSVQSNALLRMGANPLTLGTRRGDIRKNPTIWKYAKAVGLATAYIDDQMKPGELSSYMNQSETSQIDFFVQVTGLAYERDFKAIDTVMSLLETHPRIFIFWNKLGAHSPYEGKYPPKFTRFRPHLNASSMSEDRERLINSYKNAVSWTVDSFFESLLAKVDLKKTLILYTSDHGQNLLDDGTRRTHCGLTNPKYVEALVPLFVLTEENSLKRRLRQGALGHRDRATHFQIFPTLLQVLGFEPREVREQYYLSLLEEASPASPGFTYGDIFGHMGSKVKWSPFVLDHASAASN
jgi:hypothetical protein